MLPDEMCEVRRYLRLAGKVACIRHPCIRAVLRILHHPGLLRSMDMFRLRGSMRVLLARGIRGIGRGIGVSLPCWPTGGRLSRGWPRVTCWRLVRPIWVNPPLFLYARNTHGD